MAQEAFADSDVDMGLMDAIDRGVQDALCRSSAGGEQALLGEGTLDPRP